MTDFALVNGDLDLSTGDLRIAHGREAIAQRISIRLRSFLGEWFLDVRFGFPWYQSVIGVKGSVDYSEYLIRQTILSVPGVLGFRSFKSTFDKATRVFTVDFVVSTIDGDIVINDTAAVTQ